MHERSCFVTLTYDEGNLPFDESVDVAHWQKFARDLRYEVGKFRYLHVGEYGGKFGRPHYHALLFGVDFSEDRVELRRGSRGAFRSGTLEKVWGRGLTECADLSYANAFYCARYVVEKITGEEAEAHYTRKRDGQEWQVRPEYSTQSRRPGLGASWFARYWRDVYPDDCVRLADGKVFPPPAYYDALLKKVEPDVWEEVRAKREKSGTRQVLKGERDWHRLATKARVTKARLGFDKKPRRAVSRFGRVARREGK